MTCELPRPRRIGLRRECKYSWNTRLQSADWRPNLKTSFAIQSVQFRSSDDCDRELSRDGRRCEKIYKISKTKCSLQHWRSLPRFVTSSSFHRICCNKYLHVFPPIIIPIINSISFAAYARIMHRISPDCTPSARGIIFAKLQHHSLLVFFLSGRVLSKEQLNGYHVSRVLHASPR